MDDRKRREMLETIRREWQFCARQIGSAAPADAVLEAMARVPREDFVPEEIRARAFDNNALPIGEGQTISQPFIVALMTDLLRPEAGHRVLEVGTGSGYQAAVLAELVARVCTIEVVRPLAAQARALLAQLGYANVEVRCGDGYRGWPEEAPFDGILVAAAAPHVPPALKEQLAPGGRLVVPVGLPFSHQELMLIEKDAQGRFTSRTVLGVAFVPLTGEGQGRRA